MNCCKLFVFLISKPQCASLPLNEFSVHVKCIVESVVKIHLLIRISTIIANLNVKSFIDSIDRSSVYCRLKAKLFKIINLSSYKSFKSKTISYIDSLFLRQILACKLESDSVSFCKCVRHLLDCFFTELIKILCCLNLIVSYILTESVQISYICKV